MNQKNYHEETNYLSELIENTTDAIFSSDSKMKILTWNKGAEFLLGFTKAEAIGKTSYELGFVSLNEEFVKNAEQEIKTKGQWKAELIYKHKNGKRFQAAVTANLIKDKEGSIYSFVFVVKDISQIKVLEASEKKFKALLENSNDGILFLDEELRIFYRSPSANKITGWTDEELSNKPAYIHIHPEDRVKAINDLNKAKNNPADTVIELIRNQHKNGQYRWLETRCASHLNDESVRAIVLTVSDVTDRLEAEQKLIESERKHRAIFKNSHDVIVLYNNQFQTIYRSISATTITGWTDEDMIGNTGLLNVHPDDHKLVLNVVNDLVNKKESIANVSVRLRHKNGHYIWIEGTALNFLEDDSVKAVVFNFRDITDKKLAEDQLRESEHQFRYTLDTMMEGVQIIGYDWKYKYVNEALVKESKYSKEELIGFTMMEKYPGIEHTGMFAVLQKCMNDRKSKIMENEFVFPDGSIQYFELSIQPSPQGIFILSLNITERRKAQEELIKSEKKFRNLIEDGYDVVTLFDNSFKVTYRSPSSDKVLGWTDEDMMGESGQKHVHPDDLRYAKKVINNVLTNVGTLFPVQVRLLHKEGHYIWIDGTLINRLNDPNIQAIVFNYRDITDKKLSIQKLEESEKQFRKLVERISDSFLELDNELRITYLNNAASKMLNRESSSLVGKKMYEEFREGIGGEFYNAVMDAFKTGKIKRIDSYSNIFKKWISAFIYPSESGLTCFFKDNTETKKLEMELKQQQKQEQLNIISAELDMQEKERNAIGIELHDNVNQILVGTTMFLSMLKKKPENSDQIIEESITNIKDAINENRKIAHLLVTPDLDYKHLPEQITYLCNKMLQPSGIDFTTDYKNYRLNLDNLNQKITIYRIAQEQFTNIIKHAEASEVKVILTTPDDCTFMMKITDNGKGMDPDKLNKGIGLRNINSRLSLFGGKMKIDTNPDKGFSVEITMPIENDSVTK